MSRVSLLWGLALVTLVMVGCREPLDFDRALTADPERGKALYMENCANTCHPQNAFAQTRRKAKNFDQLAYAVRDYYEEAIGRGQDYSQQDVFDITRYLDAQYYHFHHDFSF